MCKGCRSTCHTSPLFQPELNQHGLYIQQSFLCGAPFPLLKGQEVECGPSAAAQACTICACPVTLSSSSNIQTSVQFKLAGHGPVTYFPDNMLCNIKDEAVCHQLTNLYRHSAPAKRHQTPDGTARRKQKRNEHSRGSKEGQDLQPSLFLCERGEQGRRRTSGKLRKCQR